MKTNYRKYGEMKYDYIGDKYTFTIYESYDEAIDLDFCELITNKIDTIVMTGKDIAKDYGSSTNYEAAKKEIIELYELDHWGFRVC